MMNETRTIKVVCECKAHSNPIGTTDWLKFLGKVYVEEVNTGSTVNGCFISLSGVNGNVSGSFENLKQKNKSNVELITGDDLYSLLIKCFPAVEREKAINIINNQSNKRIMNVSLAYYEAEIFWVISLESDRFTVLNNKGDILNSENIVVCLLKDNVAGTHLDLEEEKQKIEHQKLIESVIFSILSKHNGKMESTQCFSEVEQKLNESKVELTKSCYDQAINSIGEQDFVICENNIVELKLSEPNARILFLRYVFPLGVNIDLLSSNYFENLLDLSLLQEIEKVQCNLSLPEEEKSLCLKVLRSSPSALWLAVNEIGMITHHRKTQPESTEQLDKHDIQLFIRYICEKLKADYDNPNLKQFYFEKAEIVELDFEFSLKAKRKSAFNIVIVQEM